MQIVWPDGTLARFPAGGAFEKELVADITARLATKALGVFTTQAQVRDRVGEAMLESFAELTP